MSGTRKREEFFVHTLGNGIRCILKRVPTSAVCYCSMTIGAGSRDEEQGEYGIAHLLEHTLFIIIISTNKTPATAAKKITFTNEISLFNK